MRFMNATPKRLGDANLDLRGSGCTWQNQLITNKLCERRASFFARSHALQKPDTQTHLHCAYLGAFMDIRSEVLHLCRQFLRSYAAFPECTTPQLYHEARHCEDCCSVQDGKRQRARSMLRALWAPEEHSWLVCIRGSATASQ